MKKYILIAGVNGAGKSTLFYLLKELKDMPRVNTDDIIREFGKWDNFSDVMKAGKIAIERINQFIAEGITFNQETTLCGKSIIKNIRKAKSNGYYIEIHYVGVDTVEIAKERVKHRVLNGGHGIPDKDIERRYIETFQNLKEIFDECNLLAFYDNTVDFKRFAVYENGKQLMISKEVPGWFKQVSKEKEER